MCGITGLVGAAQQGASHVEPSLGVANAGVDARLGATTLAVGVAQAPAIGPSFRDEVMADNPAGYWRLGEASGSLLSTKPPVGTRGRICRRSRLACPVPSQPS